MAHPDLPAEQAYVDHAYACLDRMRGVVERAADATDSEVAALALEAWAARRLRTFEDAERGLCFGRLDLDTTPKPLYVGRRWVHDDDESELLVVNWQAPAARPFYVATPTDPHNVTLRRRFRTEGRRVLDLSDETLDGSGSIAGGDFLLDELERSREPHMRDIVATIQADQYRLITREPSPLLVVQGGPGTGKTAVGLHRASYLLYSQRERLRRVLVVGPNPTFMEYVSHVLPTLGEESVEQRAVGELADGIVPSVADAAAAERLKGDVRLADVIERAAAERSTAQPEELVARMEGEYVRVRERVVSELLDEVRGELGLTAHARERFRMSVLRRFYEDYGARLGGLAWRDFGEVERTLNAKGFLARWLDRVWPAVSPDGLVRSLLTSHARLGEAADGILDPAEQRLLHRPRAGFGWSEHDVALVDEARALLAERPRSFGHVIVDEAQDLTPMQLRMVARRAPSGSITILGDIAQATGPGLLPTAGRTCSRTSPARRPTSRSSATPIACPPRSWSSRCRCSTGSPPASRRPSPSAAEARHRASSASPRAISSPRHCARRAGWRGRRASSRSSSPTPRARLRGRLGVRRRHSPPLAATREGARVRPRRRGGAGAHRGGRDRPPRALRRTDAADPYARRRPRPPAARGAWRTRLVTRQARHEPPLRSCVNADGP